MQILRFLLAVVATWLIFTVGGAVWHETLFKDYYDQWVFGIERLELPVMFFVVSHLARALVFVYIYDMLYKSGSPVLKGLKFGFMMGMLTGLTVTSYYGDFDIESPLWAVLEFAFNIFRALLAGILIALIIGERGK